MFCIVGCGSGCNEKPKLGTTGEADDLYNDVRLVQISFSFGMIAVGNVACFDTISGAHFNPAV